MAKTEKQIQEGIQTFIQGMSEFANADVTINDWDLLDASVENAPYVIIQNADDFISRQDTVTPTNNYDVLVILFEAFTDKYKTTFDNLRDRRQAILDELNSNDNRSADGLQGVTIDVIKPGSGILPYFPPGTPRPENSPDAIPTYYYQVLVLEAEQF